MKAHHPFCCYCGGSAPTTTVDHMPPAIFFDRKHRPQGFEFPACDACNHRTSGDEQLAALIARSYPDSEHEDVQQETARIMTAVNNNRPGALREMMPSAREARNFMKKEFGLRPGRDGFASQLPVLKVGGPLVFESLTTFARKLTCAVHYYLTRRIIPPDGAMWIRIYSNVEFSDDPIPEEFLNKLGDPLTLRQGRFSVEDQFALRMANSSDGRLSAYFAKFRLAMGIVGLVHCAPPEGFGPDHAVRHQPFRWD